MVWARGLAAAIAATALFGVPSAALAAGGPAAVHGHRPPTAGPSPALGPQVGVHAQRATSSVALASSPTPTLSAHAAAITSAPALAAAASTPAPVAGRAPATLAAARPAPSVAGIPVAALAPESEAWPRGVRIAPVLEGFPEVVLPPGPEGTRIAIALFVLPLLVGAWLWAAVRAAVAVSRARDARTRKLLAQQLGVTAGELAGLGPTGLLRLRDQVAFDDLTGVARRAAGLAALEREASRARRHGLALAVAFVDVDGLKHANDTLGHETGDHLLRGIAGLLTGRLRGHDVVFRFGGDEFVAVLPATPARVATSILEDIRARAQRSGLSFSYGVAQLREGEAVEELLARADAIQYEDKRARRAARAS